MAQALEYDFIEKPREGFHCPVTLEILTEPHLTLCCGNHLSQEAADRLKREGKPCPMCNEPNLNTMPDKFFERQVNQLKVRCSEKASGCKWVGELGDLKKHLSGECQYTVVHAEACVGSSYYGDHIGSRLEGHLSEGSPSRTSIRALTSVERMHAVLGKTRQSELISQELRFPGIHFLGNWQEPVTSEGAMIQWPDIGIEFSIPQRAVPAGKLLNLTVMPCLGGPFVLPNSYDIASPVYMVSPAFDFSEKVQLSMTHFMNPETDEDCEDMTFISAPSLPTFRDDIPEYHFKVLQKGTFHKNTRVGTIALRHFCALAIGRKRRQSANTMAPSAKKSCNDVVYSVQLHQASDQALFCVTICHPVYEKNLRLFLHQHYPDTSFHPSTKAPVVFSGSKVSLEILPGTTGWSIRKPCEISKAEVDLPLQCPDYASESLYYPPKMWLRLSSQTSPTQSQTSLKVCGLTEELEFSLESHLQCSRHSGVVAVPDRPKLPELISFPGREGRMNILQQIGTRYDQFGILILEDETGARLAAIVDRQHGDVIRINREIFQIWLQGSGRHPITWGTLVQCLWDAELNNLADEIAAIKLQQ